MAINIAYTGLPVPPPLKWVPYAEKFKVVATKRSRVLQALLAGQRLTARDAAFELDIFCLSQMIYHMRRYHGIPIQTCINMGVDGYGLVTRYAEYFLGAVDIAASKTKKVPQ